MWSLVQVQNETQRALAGELIGEYLRWINASVQREYGLTFDIDTMLDSDIGDALKFHPPFGRFYLAQSEQHAAGVGCLKRIGDHVGEVQRMYVRPEFRGQGISRLIAARLISDARHIGYRALRLESLKFLTAAHALYHSLGFKEITPYANNSMRNYQATTNFEQYQTNVVFMELVL